MLVLPLMLLEEVVLHPTVEKRVLDPAVHLYGGRVVPEVVFALKEDFLSCLRPVHVTASRRVRVAEARRSPSNGSTAGHP